jgi:acyl-CoA reductase-like NAD-dependent aldehyde dehydrogenase
MSGGPHDALELGLTAPVAGLRAGLDRCFEVLNPHDGTVVGRAPEFDVGTLASFIENGLYAASMLRSTRSVQDRLRGWAQKIEAQREQLARLISLETGKPIRFSRYEISTALALLNSYGSCPPISLQRDWTSAQAAFSILNWCDPVFSTVKEAAMILSSGRALIIKPSSRAPLASGFLATLWKEGDDLDALLGIAPSTNAIGMLRVTLMDSRVTEVRFQGSQDVGNFVSKACQEASVPVTVFHAERLPLVLYVRTKVEAQCDAVINQVFLQPLPSRSERVSNLYVHHALADSLIPVLLDKVRRLCVDDPLKEATDVGPVIDDVAATLTSEQIEDALLSGALPCGGKLERRGRQISPLILDQAQPFMRICNEDREGPILPVIRFSEPSELPDANCLTIPSISRAGASERKRMNRMS